jgi:hypothetical protein
MQRWEGGDMIHVAWNLFVWMVVGVDLF